MAATVIGGVTLDWEMEWVERYQHEQAATVVDDTLGGFNVRQSTALPDTGTPMTLVGGWQTKDTVDALRVLAAVPGATYTVTLSGDAARTCRFRNEVRGGAVQFDYVQTGPLLAAQSRSGSEYMEGTIYLEVA